MRCPAPTGRSVIGARCAAPAWFARALRPGCPVQPSRFGAEACRWRAGSIGRPTATPMPNLALAAFFVEIADRLAPSAFDADHRLEPRDLAREIGSVGRIDDFGHVLVGAGRF